MLMRKSKLFIFTIFILAFLLFAITACTCSNKEKAELDEDIELEIRKNFFEQNSEYYSSIDKVIIHEYYGKFNGAYVIAIDFRSVLTVCFSETVDDVVFNYPTPNTLDVYKDGCFYKLQQAFDNGILTHKNLVIIKESHKEIYSFLY